ncbi:unnamed protein product [Owenia fusiformis]|uniref:Uncharacterized protein n=1 Tax=Owenia fusiformis TaxID=6347 RepID=A0A8J1UR44_OWEFU|nr:unnamed protein product [Owenia fusiformis]
MYRVRLIMRSMVPTRGELGIFVLLLIGLLFFCEFLIYYIVLLQCTWPLIDGSQNGVIKAMVLADTHLLGSRQGHWFDKLRREWQMERTFQTSMSIHNPTAVFILGDILDEGKWCSDAEFTEHVQRFHKMFRHPSTTQLFVAIGNHDIGFHFATNKHKVHRFTEGFNTSSVEHITIDGSNFILVNSMAMEGDGCHMCLKAESKLKEISKSLKCAQGRISTEECEKEKAIPDSQVIILQHFPLYRDSDRNCSGEDAAEGGERFHHFKQRYDCLSAESTNQLLDWLDPRLVLSGHTHHGCYTLHRDHIPEYTVPSFSWRNKNNPSFILLTVSSSAFAVNKCYMPKESTVVNFYIGGGTLAVLWLIFPRRFTHISWARKTH